MDDLVIGIDLGTTNSCIYVFMNNKLKILEYKSGGRIIPSFIYFPPNGGVVIGEHAKKMAVQEPKNGIYEMKRLVGRKFDDVQLQKSLGYFPFTVSADCSNNPMVSFEQKNVTVKKTPQELYTVLLKELKKYAEAKLSETINKVVITVPAYFNVTQREVTLAAAQDAGFTVLKLLNEPTAAALAYYYDQDIEETHRSLVYDFGGGTFDVAILEKLFDNVEVISVAGDTRLGGHDLDNCILDYVYQHLRDKYDYDPQWDSDDKRRLSLKCEEAKKALSDADESIITINGMVPQHPKIMISITRKQFEDMADNLFKKTIDILHNCLKDSKLSKKSIQEVILCGGSTRIPKIQEMISKYFDGKQLNKFGNPDEYVAEGAALQAAMLSTSRKQNIEKLKLTDVVPLSIGSDSLGNKMIFLIKRGSRLPVSESYTYFTVVNNQSEMRFDVYEGERSDARKNRQLGTFLLNNLAPAPPGQREVIFTLTVDVNGILTAKAEEKFSNNIKELKIEYIRSSKSDSEVENTLLAAAENKLNDERFTKFAMSKSYLINYCVRVLYNLEEQKLTDEYKEIYDFCSSTRTSADLLEMNDENKVKDLIQECKRRCATIVATHKFQFMPVEK
ncbi:hypothetical protein Zmor_011512 [Zophobas morio]|uniref:Uncharacterized protein n=1 Tax=Zophobas morio TaxID=2755281 RepID=A0AA38ITU0_9CUCU|nr:hypothetical protein Zmor_011512 [Zophobas morio]